MPYVVLAQDEPSTAAPTAAKKDGSSAKDGEVQASALFGSVSQLSYSCNLSWWHVSSGWCLHGWQWAWKACVKPSLATELGRYGTVNVLFGDVKHCAKVDDDLTKYDSQPPMDDIEVWTLALLSLCVSPWCLLQASQRAAMPPGYSSPKDWLGEKTARANGDM